MIGRLRSLGELGTWPRTNLKGSVRCIDFIFLSYKFFFLFFISSPFLFVLGDDCVFPYTGAVDATGDVVDA